MFKNWWVTNDFNPNDGQGNNRSVQELNDRDILFGDGNRFYMREAVISSKTGEVVYD